MPVEIHIPRESDHWPANIEPIIERSVIKALDIAGYKKHTEVSLVLADDDFVQDLNKRYRGKDKPTNVLSFEQDEDEYLMSLGDVIFAYQTIAREADEQGKDFQDHLSHLAVHGTLHLLGYDHETDKEAEEMEALEIKILQALDINNPYELPQG